ncbi:MAG: sugar phosphate nucleotidyltransferase [Nocardioides sp.]
MPRTRTLAIIQAGGAGSRMDVLTRERAKPSLPFAGIYQRGDFPWSNLAHSGITDVWLSVSYLGSSLEQEVANGRPWDLDRNRGGLRLLMPQEGTGSTDEDGFAQGNADELYRLRDKIRAARPDVLLVLSADHVYRFDYQDAITTHLEAGAACTIVTTERPLDEAGDHACVEVDDEGTVTGFAYKPDEPSTGTVAAEIMVYDPEVLVRVLEELHGELGADSPAGDSGLEDFGDHLLPRLVERHHVVAHAMPGYWRDVGEPHKYVEAHRELLRDDQDVFDHPGWPILTRQPQRAPARILDGAVVVDSLLSPGCRVEGRVERSVLGPGVLVAAGAVVRDSVVFPDTVVATGASVDWAVIDERCRIGEGAHVGKETDADPGGAVDPDLISVVGREATVADGATLDPGSRLEPGGTA